MLRSGGGKERITGTGTRVSHVRLVVAERRGGLKNPDLPHIKVQEQRLELKLGHSREVDWVLVGSTLDRCGAILVRNARQRKHRVKDGRVLGEEVPVNTEKTILHLYRERDVEGGQGSHHDG